MLPPLHAKVRKQLSPPCASSPLSQGASNELSALGVPSLLLDRTAQGASQLAGASHPAPR